MEVNRNFKIMDEIESLKAQLTKSEEEIKGLKDTLSKELATQLRIVSQRDQTILTLQKELTSLRNSTIDLCVSGIEKRAGYTSEEPYPHKIIKLLNALKTPD